MKAIVWTKYGPPDVLKLQEVEKPTPKDKEVLIKLHAATVTQGDCEVRAFKIPLWLWPLVRLYFGLRKPRNPFLGAEIAGEIETVGKEVTEFKTGDKVFGSCGLRLGGYAEYVCLPSKYALAIKPESMTYEEAAPVSVGGFNALHFLRKSKVTKGDKVLINGAGGSIGNFGVQIAKHWGAEVTAVDSGPKLKMLTEIGADHVIDYTKEEFWKRDEKWDVIFDVIGKAPYSGCKRSLEKRGRYILANPRVFGMVRGVWTTITSRKKVIFAMAEESKEDLDTLKELIVEGTVRMTIDRRFPLEQIVEAHTYVESGMKQGHVVITVIDSDPSGEE